MQKVLNKKGQIYIIIIILILAVLGFLFFRITKPSDDDSRADVSGKIIKEISDQLVFEGVRDPIDRTKSHISFEGFGPGKSHLGKFKEWEGSLFIEKGKIVGFEGTIQADSIDTEINMLTNHLKSADFLNSEKYPTIKFVSKRLSDNNIIGDLTFLGTTKEITFPVIIKEDSISADFVLDTSKFRDKDKETSKSSWLVKANDEVKIFFKLVK
ncbi:MAG: YceI family protein [Nanoarchaeota archaeon]